MQIFNTLTRQKEEFVPQVPGEYRIYVCGPTVYNYIHIGNARPLIVFDTLRRYLEYRGNKVIYVSNITDIDDKLIKKGQEEGTSMKEVAQRFEAEYLKDAAGLNCKKPTVQPRATEHIQQILDIVKDLIDSGHAYVAKNGDVYFRVKSDPEYGKLSHLKLDDLESGNRELRSQMEDDLKEDPADFAVWKAAKPGEPAWESPYGMGRPGWHIECSAMSRTHLGKTIDLHCGGQDLIFPHHENEIAQSECANGCEFARYWMHNGFINVDNQKMSKSLGNFFTVRDIAKEFDLEAVRMFMLGAQYRSPINFPREMIEQAKASLDRLYTARDHYLFLLQNAKDGELGEKELALMEKVKAAREGFDEAMDDDLNTADAMGKMFELVRDAVFLQYLNLAADLLVIFYIALGCWHAAPVTRLLLRSAQNHLDLETNQTMGHFFENIFHALVGLFAGIAMLDRLGVPVSGLLTGAGVAGLAVSLAAQSTLNSLIAGITLVLERPFGIGDYIVLGDCEGTVEDISFRSTRIRSPDNVAITIENSKITAEYIQNYDRRQSRLWKFTIGLTYDTPREKIEQLTADLTAMLQAQPDVQPDGVTIALDKFNDYSIDLACRVYITKVNLRDFMQVKNTLNLQILDLMKEEGCEFAFPTTTVDLPERK